MSVIATVSVPAESFALAGLFAAHPTASIEVERLASHSREWVMPAVWLVAPDPVAAAETMRADPAVESVSLIDVADETAYATIHWGERVTAFVDAIIDRHGVLKTASATAAAWELTLKFTAREALADFQAYADDHDLDVELRRLSEASAALDRVYGLTPAQREVLETALELGYFDVPREAQIDDLAAALDISTNSVSERLRRATKALTSNTIATAGIDRGST
ncbi:helix-turn-helix domain-containing protein [Halovivax limisalsi]|uniref:helix-turn-helix domain-containing protein n=1 Tax=Halovivax limisalsi TaxID=1453760 RepID=UPI001FFC43AB|nr:helix-turn-helix domain-containing protein [Halovivax limisalsi]